MYQGSVVASAWVERIGEEGMMTVEVLITRIIVEIYNRRELRMKIVVLAGSVALVYRLQSIPDCSYSSRHSSLKIWGKGQMIRSKRTDY